ncbi:MAG: FxsA family protein [Halopseudomonas sp.]
MRFLFLLFVIIPIVEIVLLINVGQAIGAWYTIGLVLLSAFIGVNMLRQQGLSTLMRARSRMDGGEIPAQEMVEGIVLAVGGALLITPGFVTDFFGFCCLIPATRHALVKPLLRHFTVVAAQQGQASFTQFSQQGSHRPHAQQDDVGNSVKSDNDAADGGQTIDGEYRRDD